MNAPGARQRSELLAAGLANQQRGRFKEAEGCYHMVLAANGADAEALYRMGVLALQCGNGAGAQHYLERALTLRAPDADGCYNLGMAHVLQQRFGEGQDWFLRAVELNAAHTPARFGLGNIYKFLGRHEASAEQYLAGIRHDALNPVLFSSMLVGLHNNASVSDATLFELHCEWGRRYAERHYPAAPRFDNDRDPRRRLRVGLVSPSFNANIVGHFLRAVVAPLAREVDLHFYDAGAQADWLTRDIAPHAAAWRSIVGMRDEDAFGLIQSDRIDILVDLAGHAPGNRLQLFARRPAPVQMTWLDYFNTTGVRTIDYVVTDPVSTPPAADTLFVETPLRLPPSRLCYALPPFAPPVAPARPRAGNHVSFGCFSRADKIGPAVILLWSRILQGVPGSRITLKGSTYDVELVRTRIAEAFERAGIARDRIEFRPPSEHADMLHQYADIDIALDPFPYNGGATTCDALLMGVPVVTLVGEGMISRQGASLLTAAGMPELIAAAPDEYVALATQLARDPARRGMLRDGLRARVLASRLCDGDGFAADLVLAMRETWAVWCGGNARAASAGAVRSAAGVGR